jgi:WD40 repeat protein
MNEARLTALLRDAPVPDERRAEERGWRMVRAAFEERPPSRPPARGTRLVVAVAVGLLILAIGLSPAGAKVADLVHDAIHPGQGNSLPELTSLPAPGRVLATSPRGAWVVADDGGKRRLGSYSDATWSPHGLFVAVTRGSELTAVEPDGTVRWSLSSHRPVSDPVWAPSGIRIGYRVGKSVRVVAGNGTDNRLVARRAAPTPPAWAPERNRNVLTFVGQDDSVRAVDVESGNTLWRSARFGGRVKSLEWSSSNRLLVVARSFFVILDQEGQAIAKGPIPGKAEAAAFSPDGRTIALARRTAAGSELALMPTGSTSLSERRLVMRPGRFTDLAWSPDGNWILLGWRDADEWLFVRPGDRKVVAASGISQQFAPGANGAVGFPGIEGWCCGAEGAG